MTIDLPRTRIAVFGSVAAVRPLPTSDAVLEAVLDAIAHEAPAVALPILDRALDEGRITPPEHRALVRELDGRGAPPAASPQARRVLSEALAAVRRAAPRIAEPILEAAVAEQRLSAAQERRILDRLRLSPRRRF